jgi:hypothetical protein
LLAHASEQGRGRLRCNDRGDASGDAILQFALARKFRAAIRATGQVRRQFSVTAGG